MSDVDSFVERRRGDTLINVVIGGVVSFVAASAIPFVGFVIGGGVSGYLQNQGRWAGAKVGTFAALATGVPGAILYFFIIMPYVGFNVLTTSGMGSKLLGGIFAVGVVLFVIAAIVSGILGGIGGYLGAGMVQE